MEMVGWNHMKDKEVLVRLFRSLLSIDFLNFLNHTIIVYIKFHVAQFYADESLATVTDEV